jgi:acyl dehydratase
VAGIREDKNIVTLTTECRKQTGEVTVTGDAKVMILE